MRGFTTSYWPRDESVSVAETTVGGVLRAAAAATPGHVAVIEGCADPTARRRWTYRQLWDDANVAARALSTRFEQGERVAVWAPNIPEWIILEFGAALAGLTLVTLNPAYRPAELSYVLNQSGAAGIFLVPAFRSPMAEFLDQVRPEVPRLREVVLFSEWEAFLATAPATAQLPDVTPSDIAQVQYTSGTTGFPKGAELHHRGLTNNARFCVECIGLGPGDVYVSPMPLFHTAGCALGVLGAVQRSAVHIPVVAFDPGLMLELCETYRAQFVLGVPTMLIALLDHPEFTARDLSAARVVVSGGSPVPAELVRRVEKEMRVRFSVVFGTTECSPLITQVRLDDETRDREETLGHPLPQTEVMVADPVTGETVPVGALGELCARGYMVMNGYHDAPEATAAAIDADGWYHTGDLASMDDRGYFRIEGRLKDMIIRGGENIYPREIEDALFAHGAVAEVAVVGVPDDRWGEVVAASSGPPARRQRRPSSRHGAANAWRRTRRQCTGASSIRSRSPRPARFRSTSCENR